jgi:catechol 2,3-dioxygenase-like lactoylglutathione lyase family enzyme
VDNSAPMQALLKPLALSHIGIHVSNLQRSLEYYRQVFGYQLVYDNEAESGQDRVLIGVVAGTAIELVKKAGGGGQGADTLTSPNGVGFSGITFSVPDVDDAYAALASRGLANMEPPVTLPNGIRLVLFRDPDGNLLEVIDLKGPKSLAEMAGLA